MGAGGGAAGGGGVGGGGALPPAELWNAAVTLAALGLLILVLVLLLRNMAIVGIVGEGEIMGRMPWGNMVPSPRPPRLLMQRVHIPFTFKLTATNKTSYSEVRCAISSTVRYERVCWWGAPVRELHTSLWLPLRQVLETDILTQHCKHSIPLTRSSAHCERSITLKLDEALSLGGPPRTCYPLVVMLAREDKDSQDLRPDDTVALVSVVHIQDAACPLPSGVLAQYLKQANGQLSCLKQLYVTGEAVVEDSPYDGGVVEDALCCVCAAKPLSRALLPCRHACLCASCFPKLDKCPICRSGISSYFCIRGEEEPAHGDASKRPSRWPVSLQQRLLDLFPYH